jgi:hypothetical protein
MVVFFLNFNDTGIEIMGIEIVGIEIVGIEITCLGVL